MNLGEGSTPLSFLAPDGQEFFVRRQGALEGKGSKVPLEGHLDKGADLLKAKTREGYIYYLYDDKKYIRAWLPGDNDPVPLDKSDELMFVTLAIMSNMFESEFGNWDRRFE